MNIAVGSLLLVIALANGQQTIYQNNFHPTQYGARIEHIRGQNSDPADYNYFYDVQDDITGDRKSQQESRSGDHVRGRYSVLDADGSTRTVEYSVDSDSGFNAVVRRDGDQISLPNLGARALPSYEYQTRGVSAPELFRNRYQQERVAQFDSRTRLAQDAVTGNVVDLHSGFGIIPHVRSNVHNEPSSRVLPNVYNHENNVNIHNHHNHEGSARSHIHSSHPEVSNHHLSTAPVHFPGSRHSGLSRANLAYDRYSIRPAHEIDERRPTPLFTPTNEAMTRSNVGTHNSQSTIAPYTDSNNLNLNIQHPAHHEIVGPTTPIPLQQNYGPTTPQPEHFSFNHSRAINHPSGQYYTSRANIINTPLQPHQSVAVHNDGVITDAIDTSTVYPQTFVTPVPLHSYNHMSPSPVPHHQNVVSPNNAHKYIYPANTIPLNADTPAHFFSRNVSPLLSLPNFGITNPFLIN